MLGGVLAATVVVDAAWSAATLLRQREAGATLLARDGSVLARRGPSWGETLDRSALPVALVDAVVAIEDRRFFEHPGLDPLGIARAAWRNLTAGRVVEGGSTITQQLAKLAFLDRERSFLRKAREAVLAIWLELRLGKDGILLAYLNRVYLGAGAHGVDAAARVYFGHSARRLDLAEAALLAGLIRAPSRLGPFQDADAAIRRSHTVLAAMVETGRISAAQAEEARSRPPRLRPDGAVDLPGPATDWIVAEARLLGPASGADFTAWTTLDPGLQARAVAAAHELLSAPASAQGLQAAAVVIDGNGDVLAMVGGLPDGGSFDRATMAIRQPGSAFKLFVALAALEAGISPARMVSTAPITVDGWSPRDPRPPVEAELSLTDVFARSVNVSTVRLAETIGRERVIALARRLGVARDLPDSPSIVLGSGGMSLLELASAYSVVTSDGVLARPRIIESVETSGGPLTRIPRSRRTPVLDPAIARQARLMLRAVVERGTGHAALLPDSGGKTGTSSAGRDGWFVGYAGALTIGVWVGRDDGQPVAGLSGGGLPAQLFRAIALAARAAPSTASQAADTAAVAG